MYLRTVQFDTRYKPTSSCTRVEVNDPTVARRFKTDRFISILSLIKFLCFSNVQLPSLLRGFDSRYWLSTIFIYSGFVIPWKRFEKFLASQSSQLVTYSHFNWVFKWYSFGFFLEWLTTLLCLLLLLIICLYILLMLLRKKKEKFISYKLKGR